MCGDLGLVPGVVGKPEAVPPRGGMRWTLSCAVSPQEDLAEGRAHGLPERGVLPSPGHRPSLRHRTSCLLHRHRRVPPGHAPEAPGLAPACLRVPARPLPSPIHPRVRRPCRLVSEQQHKGFVPERRAEVVSRRASMGRERVPVLSSPGTCPLLLLPRTIPNYAYLVLFFSFFCCLFLIVILKDTGKHRLGPQTLKSPPSTWKEEGRENINLSPRPPQLPLPSWGLQLAEEELEGQQCPVSPQPLLGCAGPQLGQVLCTGGPALLEGRQEGMLELASSLAWKPPPLPSPLLKIELDLVESVGDRRKGKRLVASVL